MLITVIIWVTIIWNFHTLSSLLPCFSKDDSLLSSISLPKLHYPDYFALKEEISSSVPFAPFNVSAWFQRFMVCCLLIIMTRLLKADEWTLHCFWESITVLSTAMSTWGKHQNKINTKWCHREEQANVPMKYVSLFRQKLLKPHWFLLFKVILVLPFTHYIKDAVKKEVFCNTGQEAELKPQNC